MDMRKWNREWRTELRTGNRTKDRKKTKGGKGQHILEVKIKKSGASLLWSPVRNCTKRSIKQYIACVMLDITQVLLSNLFVMLDITQVTGTGD